MRSTLKILFFNDGDGNVVDDDDKVNQDEVNLDHRFNDDGDVDDCDEICLENIAVDYVGDGNEILFVVDGIDDDDDDKKGVLTSVVSS